MVNLSCAYNDFKTMKTSRHEVGRKNCKTPTITQEQGTVWIFLFTDCDLDQH